MAPSADNEKKSWKDQTFHCETLTYNWPQLLKAMGLILLGFFTYTLCIAFVPAILPLKLNELGANSKTIAVILSTIGQIFNITICPMVSFQSDRYRSKRWGRRIPFILFTLPMMVAAWVLFAFVDSEASFLCKVLGNWWSISPTTMAIALIALIMVLYQFFLMYVGSVIYYIYNDTIPAEFLSRMVGGINVTVSAANMLFNFFIFAHGLTHFRSLLLLTAVCYTLGVGLMCFLLKEPRFPEPAAVEKKPKSSLKTKFENFKIFFTESFSHRFYWYRALGNGALRVVGCSTVFNAFLYMEMGMTLQDIGSMNGYIGIGATICSFAIAIAGAYYVDRWHPMKVWSILSLFSCLFFVLNCKWMIFSPGGRNLWWIMVLTTLATKPQEGFKGISNMPMQMRIFPKTRFGQFCSAQAMLRSAMVLLGGLLYGVIIDWLRFQSGLGDRAYRFMFFWQTFWTVAGAVFTILSYLEFQKLGGVKGYRAPAKWSPDGFETMPVTPVDECNKKLLYLALNLSTVAVLIPLLSTLFFAWRANQLGLATESVRFLTNALPCALAAVAIWLLVQWGIRRDVARVSCAEKPKFGIPHHGMILFAGSTQIMIAGIGCFQSYIMLNAEATASAAWMQTYECGIAILFSLLVWGYTFLDRSGSIQDADRQ